MPDNQVYNEYQGIAYLISTNKNIAWVVAYKAPSDLDTGLRRLQCKADKMYVILEKCIDEIERHFHIQVK